METIGGRHWAAIKVPDDSYIVAPNWFSITNFDFNSDDTMASDDLEKMIQDNHMDIDHSGNPYNLRHIFGSHDDSDGIFKSCSIRAMFMNLMIQICHLLKSQSIYLLLKT